MTIILYKFDGENNLVDKSNAWGITGRTSRLTDPLTLTGYLRENSSLINPKIVVELQSPLTIPTHNYAYIQEFNRYYFVDDIVSAPERGKGMVIYSLRVDVLQTYKNALAGLSAYIERNETVYDAYIADEKRDSRVNNIVTFNTNFAGQLDPFFVHGGSPYVANGGNIVLTVITSPSRETGERRTTPVVDPLQFPSPYAKTINKQNRSYCITQYELTKLTKLLNTKDFFESVAKGVYGVGTEAIISATIFPFDIYQHDLDHVATTQGKISITDKDIEDSTDPVNTPLARLIDTNYNNVIDLGTYTPFGLTNDWRDFEPYTRYSVYIPYVGWHYVATQDMVPNGIRVQYIVDIINGSAIAVISTKPVTGVTTRIIDQIPCRIGTKIALNQSNAVQVAQNELNNMLGAATSLISLGIGAGTGNPVAMAGGVLSLAKVGASAISNRYIMRGTPGETNLMQFMPQKMQILKSKQNIIIDDEFHHWFGAPKRATATIASLKGSGYTEMRLHLESGFSGATSAEKTELENLCASGVIL